MPVSDFSLHPLKMHGHKWLHVEYLGRSTDVCIDDWFNFAHSDSVSCVTLPGWLSLDKFSFAVDSVGNYIMEFPTCFGFHSTRNGKLRVTGDFHSRIVVCPQYLEAVKSYINN